MVAFVHTPGLNPPARMAETIASCPPGNFSLVFSQLSHTVPPTRMGTSFC